MNKRPDKYKETEGQRKNRIATSMNMNTKVVIPKNNYKRSDNKQAIDEHDDN